MTANTATTVEEPTEIASQAQLLDRIFELAIAHDSKCQRAEDQFYRYCGYRGPAPHGAKTTIESDTFEDLETEHRSAMIEVCAAVAAAAVRRLAVLGALADELVDRGLVIQLAGKPLEDFLRPIFEESGIGDRFEAREGFQVFKTAND